MKFLKPFIPLQSTCRRALLRQLGKSDYRLVGTTQYLEILVGLDCNSALWLCKKMFIFLRKE